MSITGVITHLLSGMSHQVVIPRGYMFHTCSTRPGPRRRPCAQGLRSVRAAWREELATELAKNKGAKPKKPGIIWIYMDYNRPDINEYELIPYPQQNWG